MRLVVPYLLVLMLISTCALSAGSPLYTAFAILQIIGWTVATISLRYRIPVLHRVAAPASALLVLNAAAVVGLHKFLFTRGPLWKIWNSSKPVETSLAAEAEVLTQPEPIVAPVMDIGKSDCNDHVNERSIRSS
jgi:hypothetical protein